MRKISEGDIRELSRNFADYRSRMLSEIGSLKYMTEVRISQLEKQLAKMLGEKPGLREKRVSLSMLPLQPEFRYITRDEHDDLEQQEESPRINYIETHYARSIWNRKDTRLDAFRKIAEIATLNGREEIHTVYHALRRVRRTEDRLRERHVLRQRVLPRGRILIVPRAVVNGHPEGAADIVIANRITRWRYPAGHRKAGQLAKLNARGAVRQCSWVYRHPPTTRAQSCQSTRSFLDGQQQQASTSTSPNPESS